MLLIIVLTFIILNILWFSVVIERFHDCLYTAVAQVTVKYMIMEAALKCDNVVNYT